MLLSDHLPRELVGLVLTFTPPRRAHEWLPIDEAERVGMPPSSGLWEDGQLPDKLLHRISRWGFEQGSGSHSWRLRFSRDDVRAQIGVARLPPAFGARPSYVVQSMHNAVLGVRHFMCPTSWLKETSLTRAKISRAQSEAKLTGGPVDLRMSVDLERGRVCVAIGPTTMWMGLKKIDELALYRPFAAVSERSGATVELISGDDE